MKNWFRIVYHLAEMCTALSGRVVIWMGVYVLKASVYISALIKPFKKGKVPKPKTLMQPHTIRDGGSDREFPASGG